MGKTWLNLQPALGPDAVDRVRDTLDRLEPGEEIIINIESADAHQADPVIGLLERSGFDYQAKGSHDGKNYYINARKPPA